MKMYTLTFQNVETTHNPHYKKYVKKVNKHKADDMVDVGADGKLTVLEKDILKYWEYGVRVDSCVYAGEMPDSYFNPVLSEHDFVESQIKSKKNGETIGYQG